jgi:hypothetical protein
MTRTSVLDEDSFCFAIERLTPVQQAVLLHERESLSTLVRAAASRSRSLGKLDVVLSSPHFSQ